MSKKSDVECPECGAVLDTTSNQIKKHIFNHWGIDVDKDATIDNPEAQKRIDFLMDAIDGGDA